MKKKTMSRWIALLLAGTMAFGVMGCGASETQNEENSQDSEVEESSVAEEEPAEIPTLKIYVSGNEYPDLAMVVEEANKIIEEEIGARIDLQYLSGYGDNMNMIMAAQEEFDLCWTSNWSNPYTTGLENESYIPLTDLIDENCPELWDIIPEIYWKAVTFDEEVYFIPNQQMMVNYQALAIRKSLVDKYNIDTDAVKSIDDIEPILQMFLENEPELIPYQVWGDFWTSDYSAIVSSVGLDWNADGYKAIYKWENEGYLDYIKTHRDWFEKGYIRSDIASVLDDTNDYLAGKYAVVGTSWNPLTERTLEQKLGEDQVLMIINDDAYIQRDNLVGTMWAVSATSKHPDKAVQFVYLMNTNQELFNLLAYGIEGTHYEWVDEEHIKLDKESGYYVNAAWKLGNTFLGYPQEGEPANVHELTKEMSNRAQLAKGADFVFDTSNVETEIAQMETVNEEYRNLLVNGSADWEDCLDEYIEKMMNAGAENVLNEVQRQLDEFYGQ